MNFVPDVIERTARGVKISDTPDGLSEISAPGCAATVWRRTPLQSFQAWIDACAPSQLPSTRVILRSERVRDAMVQVCEACGTPAHPERDRLVDDSAALAQLFAELSGVDYLRLRLDVVTTNACRKFHIDGITSRLVCTYRGTGTQYGTSVGGADPETIFTVPTASPIVLRGTLWPEHPESGLLHRSPPIEGSGETRLVLVLDPIHDLKDHTEEQILH